MSTKHEHESREREGGRGRFLKPATKSKSKHYFGLAEIGTGLKWREDFRHGLGKGQEEVADCGCRAQSTNHRLQFRLDTALRYRYKERCVRGEGKEKIGSCREWERERQRELAMVGWGGEWLWWHNSREYMNSCIWKITEQKTLSMYMHSHGQRPAKRCTERNYWISSKIPEFFLLL